jgi:hypothetical protein
MVEEKKKERTKEEEKKEEEGKEGENFFEISAKDGLVKRKKKPTSMFDLV